MFLLSQCLVSVATLLDLASFQFKSRRLILLCLFGSVLLTAWHFFLLGQQSAGWLMLIAATRYLYCVFARQRLMMLCFILFSVTAVLLTWHSWLSGIALAATLIQTVASFQSQDLKLRSMMLVGTSMWIAHNIMVVSPIAVVMECLFLTSNIVGLYRFYRDKPFLTKAA